MYGYNLEMEKICRLELKMFKINIKGIWDKIEDSYWFIFYRSSFAHRTKEIYYSIFGTKPHIVKTELKPTSWIDKDSILMYSMMKLIIDFVDEEKAFTGHVDWDYDETHKDARTNILEVYNWWKNYPNRQKEISEALDKWHDKSSIKKWFDKENKDEDYDSETKVYRMDNKHANPEDEIVEKDLFGALHLLEEKLDKEEEEMMHKIVKYRHFLWT